MIAFAYYAKVVKSTWFDDVPAGVDTEALTSERVVPSLQLALGLTVIGVLILGIFPGLIADLGDLTTGFIE